MSNIYRTTGKLDLNPKRKNILNSILKHNISKNNDLSDVNQFDLNFNFLSIEFNLNEFSNSNHYLYLLKEINIIITSIEKLEKNKKKEIFFDEDDENNLRILKDFSKNIYSSFWLNKDIKKILNDYNANCFSFALNFLTQQKNYYNPDEVFLHSLLNHCDIFVDNNNNKNFFLKSILENISLSSETKILYSDLIINNMNYKTIDEKINSFDLLFNYFYKTNTNYAYLTNSSKKHIQNSFEKLQPIPMNLIGSSEDVLLDFQSKNSFRTYDWGKNSSLTLILASNFLYEKYKNDIDDEFIKNNIEKIKEFVSDSSHLSTISDENIIQLLEKCKKYDNSLCLIFLLSRIEKDISMKKFFNIYDKFYDHNNDFPPQLEFDNHFSLNSFITNINRQEFDFEYFFDYQLKKILYFINDVVLKRDNDAYNNDVSEKLTTDLYFYIQSLSEDDNNPYINRKLKLNNATDIYYILLDNIPTNLDEIDDKKLIYDIALKNNIINEVDFKENLEQRLKHFLECQYLESSNERMYLEYKLKDKLNLHLNTSENKKTNRRKF